MYPLVYECGVVILIEPRIRPSSANTEETVMAEKIVASYRYFESKIAFKTNPNDQEMALENEEEEYYDESRGWIRFPDEPIKDNHPFMVEFYANALETDFGGVVLGNQWLVNKLYGGERPEWFTSNRGVDCHGFTPGMKS
ncbi:hypothetical protein KY290_027738 [Solanum tuberosum]|uniref:Uncharacterized protein n=1 Tax=Solanum tuberosum TaxID=4113 RepID=A0ABQ7UHR3_SOLTU|nr:hypothetical protein KY285_026712 [Solanum tuberosum]KAH0748506.1 hypothetical protein KY290_027738 [Solanum tuberosum]